MAVCSVVALDTAEYQRKCKQLLSDTATYKNLGTKDPTSKYKDERVAVLKDLEDEGAINHVEYRTQQLILHQSSMGCQKYTKRTSHFDQL